MQLGSKLHYYAALRMTVFRCSLRRPVGDTGHLVKIGTESLVLLRKYLSSCFSRQVSCFPGSPFLGTTRPVLCQPFYQYGTRLLAKYIHLAMLSSTRGTWAPPHHYETEYGSFLSLPNPTVSSKILTHRMPSFWDPLGLSLSHRAHGTGAVKVYMYICTVCLSFRVFMLYYFSLPSAYVRDPSKCAIYLLKRSQVQTGPPVLGVQ